MLLLNSGRRLARGHSSKSTFVSLTRLASKPVSMWLVSNYRSLAHHCPSVFVTHIIATTSSTASKQDFSLTRQLALKQTIETSIAGVHRSSIAPDRMSPGRICLGDRARKRQAIKQFIGSFGPLSAHFSCFWSWPGRRVSMIQTRQAVQLSCFYGQQSCSKNGRCRRAILGLNE